VSCLLDGCSYTIWAKHSWARTRVFLAVSQGVEENEIWACPC
jgi:hypothetical protein